MKKLLWLSAVFACMFFAGCKKETSYFPPSQNNETVPAPSSNTQDFSFTKLKAVPDTIKVGEYADIYATATGKNLAYTWYVVHGDLFGSGYHIQCGAQPCCVGMHQIKCTVSDGTHSAVKDIWITIVNN
jgi:hypothetical protein